MLVLIGVGDIVLGCNGRLCYAITDYGVDVYDDMIWNMTA
jgi:hypothetical protein